LNKNQGRREQARAEEQKAISMKTAQLNETNIMIRSAYFRVKNSERLVGLYRDQLLPQASQAMEVAETWFRQKQGSFTDFIETESVYYNFQLSLARAKADYGRYLAQLEKLCGVSLTAKRENGGGKAPEVGAR
jgi:outer membrane protein TolC